MSDVTSRLEAVWEAVQSGESIDGRIDVGDAYIAYETEPIGSSRYFKIWVGQDDEYIGASPPRPVVDAIAMVLGAVPDVDFLPESGEMYASVKL